MMGRVSITKLLCGSGLALLGAVTPAHAQSSEADIVVTARRVEERLQDVPISITVFNQEQLANANIVNASDLASITPSLTSNNNFGAENSSYAIRGFVQDNGTAPAVGVYFADVVSPRGASNGLPAGDGAGPGSFFDLQNVQVLKGPQGTLFGRNTTGGAVLLVPQRPTDEFEGYLEAGGGNYGMEHYQGVLNVPLSDTARLRVGLDRMSRDGFINNVSGVGPGDFGDVNYTAARVSFVADLAPNLENYTVASYTHSDTNGYFQKLIRGSADALGGFALGQLAAQDAAGDTDFYDAQQDLTNPQSELTQWQIVNTTTWDINDSLTFKNIASYAELTDDLRSPIFGTGFISPDLTGFGGPPATRFVFANSQPIPGGHTAHQNTITEEMRLEGVSFDNHLTWQTGAYLEVSNPLSTVGSQSPTVIHCDDSANLQCTDILTQISVFFGGPATPSGLVNVTRGQTKFQDMGVYAQGTWAFNDQWRLTAGMRYTWDRESIESQQITNLFFAPNTPTPVCTNPLAAAPDCETHTSTQSEAPTWLLGVDYTPTEDLLLYAKYARGYRAGVIAPNVVAPFNIVRPEQVDAYEIGSKFSFGGPMPGILNTALFFNEFSDQQVQLGFSDNPLDLIPLAPTAAPFNIGGSEIYGLEVDFAITPFTGLRLSAGYTYLHTEITEVNIPDSPGSIYVLAEGSPESRPRVGDPITLSPENKFTLSARYTLPLPESIGEITFGGTYVYTDEQLTNYIDRGVAGFEDLSTIDSTALLNLNFSWDSIFGAPVDLLVFGTNVTDEEYYTYIPGLAASTGFETAAFGQPRMYGASLRYHF